MRPKPLMATLTVIGGVSVVNEVLVKCGLTRWA